MSTPKIEKLINFYNDKSIEQAEKLVVANKLVPMLLEERETKIQSSHLDNYKYDKLLNKIASLNQDNLFLNLNIDKLNLKLIKEAKSAKTKRDIMFFLGLLIGIIIA